MKLNFSHSALFHTNVKVCLIYFGQDCSNEIKNSKFKKQFSLFYLKNLKLSICNFLSVLLRKQFYPKNY